MPKVVRQVARPKRKRRKAALASAWDATDGIRMNAYGRSGTGKTTFWGTFPGPILALICSGGSKPGELKSLNTPEMRRKITAPIISEPKQVDELVAEQRETGHYTTVVLDHASSFLRLVLKEILDLNRAPLTLKWGTATQAQWGIINSQVIERLDALLSLSCNVVIVGQEREFKPKEGDEGYDEDGILAPYIASDVTPGVLRWLYPAADYTCQTFIRQKTKEQIVTVNKKKIRRQVPVKGVEYCLRTAPSSVCMTKFRVPKGTKLPDAIVDPTFEKIQALIRGGG